MTNRRVGRAQSAAQIKVNLGGVFLRWAAIHFDPRVQPPFRTSMDTNATEISSLTSKADLTEVHAQSDLPFSHDSRRTRTGFLVEGPRLLGYVPTPPSKQGDRSWVWDHGEHITRQSDGNKFFLCRVCWDKAVGNLTKIIPQHTTRIIRHLTDKHAFDSQGNRRQTVQEAKESGQVNIMNLLKRQADAQASPFD